MTSCKIIAQDYDVQYKLSNYNVTVGSYVEITCRRFAERITGSSNVTCLSTGQWSADVPTCSYTGELNLYEKIIIGVSSACAIFFVLCLFLICCLAYRWMRSREHRSKRQYDEDSYPPSHINYNAKGYYGSDVSESGRRDYRGWVGDRRQDDWDQDEAEARRKDYRKYNDRLPRNDWDRDLSETRRNDIRNWGQEPGLEPYDKKPIEHHTSGIYNTRINRDSIRDEGYTIYTGKSRRENVFDNRAYDTEGGRELGQSRAPYREYNDVRRTQRDPYY